MLDLNVSSEYADHSSLQDIGCEEKPKGDVQTQVQETRVQVGVQRAAPTIIAQIGGIQVIKEGRRLQRYRQGV